MIRFWKYHVYLQKLFPFISLAFNDILPYTAVKLFQFLFVNINRLFVNIINWLFIYIKNKVFEKEHNSHWIFTLSMQLVKLSRRFMF